MGCLKLTYYPETELKTVAQKKELTTKISSQTLRSSYLFGFNGQEKDDEVAGAGNTNTAMFWEYDTRLGRRWNLDPEYNSNPNLSPYACFNDNPIIFADPSGESGIVTLDKKNHTITISSTFIYYGGEATLKNAQAASNEIADRWNRAKATVTIEGVVYKVNFKIHYQVVTEEEAIAMAKNNTNVEKNFVRIDNSDKVGSSCFLVGSNCGYFSTRDNIGSSTSIAHEAGHGWGLGHSWISKYLSKIFAKKYPEVFDARGKGQPGIMACRGTLVDAKYTRDPKQGDSKADEASLSLANTVDPKTRLVTTEDVANIFTPSIIMSLINKGKANIGSVKNYIYDKDGKVIR